MAVTAVIPFLGPVIAVWVLLAAAVMAYYYLVVVRTQGHRAADERVSPPEPRPAPWAEPPRAESYEMENFPDDDWRATA